MHAAREYPTYEAFALDHARQLVHEPEPQSLLQQIHQTLLALWGTLAVWILCSSLVDLTGVAS